MLNRHNRLLVTIYVLSDALLGMSAFIVAYALRFHTGLPVPRGVPPLAQYFNVLPFIATLVPLGFAGLSVIDVSGAERSMTQWSVDGVVSTLPEASVARTAKLCSPSPSPLYVTGEVHDAIGARSREHSNVEPASVDVKLYWTDVLLVVAGGPDVIVVLGGVSSTMALPHPAAARASTAEMRPKPNCGSRPAAPRSTAVLFIAVRTWAPVIEGLQLIIRAASPLTDINRMCG